MGRQIWTRSHADPATAAKAEISVAAGWEVLRELAKVVRQRPVSLALNLRRHWAVVSGEKSLGKKLALLAGWRIGIGPGEDQGSHLLHSRAPRT